MEQIYGQAGVPSVAERLVRADLGGIHEDECRRTAERVSLNCPTLFWLNGRIYHATMVDASDSGAQFSASALLSGPVHMAIGDEMDVSIQTPYGVAERGAVVQWKERLDGTLRWGVRFDHQETDDLDPLTCLAHRIG